MRSRLIPLVVTLLLASGLAVVAAPAGSAVAPTTAPTNLVADFGSDPANAPQNPTLRWNGVAGAGGYHVQIATNDSFSTIVYDVSTVTSAVTPDKALPIGTLSWRVAATDGSSGTGPFATGQFEESWAHAPAPLSPKNYDPNDPSTVLNYPNDPAVFSWTALAGAKDYTLQIDDDQNFIGAQSYTTSNNSYTLLEPQTINQQFFWRVQANSRTSGVVSQWSDVQSYMYGWSSTPQLETPADGTTTEITDVEFSWDPVDGAKNYELQVSPNGDWTNNVLIDMSGLTSTRWVPPAPLPNGSYFWRVRALDAATTQHFGNWSAVSSFTRGWTDQPTLVTPAYDPANPADIPTVVGYPDFAWTPVPHAAYYQLEFSADRNFSSSVFNCFTNHTEWTPYTRTSPGNVGEPGACVPPAWQAGTTYYWRVRGLDDATVPTGTVDSSDIVGLWSGTGAFIRNPASPSLLAPEGGATVEVPTLSWGEVDGAEHYVVTLKNKNGGAASGFPATTHATSITPAVALSATLAPYTWTVQAVDAAGVASIASPARQFSTTPVTSGSSFSLTSPADGTASRLMPELVWTPVTNATNYIVHVSVNGFEQTPLTTKDAYPAFTPANVAATAGTYTWWVEAQDSSGGSIGTSDSRTFTVLPLDSLAASDYLTPARCDVQSSCQPVNDTPTFSWKPVANAAFYQLTIANDRNFTNVVRQYTTAYTTLTPRESLLDSQAGQAYYWFVRPCFDENMVNCGPGADDTGVNGNAGTFRKQSAPVQLISPTSQSSVPNQITFKWQDYLASEDGTGASQEAARYLLQVATSADFNAGSIIDHPIVDATSYTLATSTYPEGPLYWRVQAIDESGNSLTWSANDGSTTFGWLVTKSSPAPTPTYPADGATVARVPYLAWDAQRYAATYTVELYKNGDLNASSTNLVTSQTTKFAAWAPTVGLAKGDYAWRVRRVDASGKVGPWSAMRIFHVAQQAPLLTSPAPGAVLNSTNALFTWTSVPGASQYRWQVSPNAGFTTTTLTQTTVNNSWAPPARFSDGTFYWRVQVLDGAGNVLATSDARTFTHDATAPTVKSYAPSSSLAFTGPITATFSEPVNTVTPSTFRVGIAGTSTSVAGTVSLATVSGVPTATWRPTAPLLPGQTYAVSLTNGITDLSGNPLTPRSWNVRTATTVDNVGPGIAEHWDHDTASAASGGGYDASRTAGSTVTFTFHATGVSVLGTLAKNAGNASISLDGKVQKTVSFYSATTRFRRSVWSRSGLPLGNHTVSIRVLGTHAKGATDNWVYIDGFSVGTVSYDQNNPAVVEAFPRVRLSSASGGSYDWINHATTGDNGGRPSFTASFRGTGVTVYGVKSPSSGNAAIYVDGILKSTVSVRGSVTTVASIYAVSGLADRVHTIRIDVVGTPTGSGSSVAIDSLRIT